MKIIIDIPDHEYKYTCERTLSDRTFWDDAIRNGTPLDEIKAIMEKQIERDFAFAETETLKVPCHYGTANGLQVAVRILDNIGKAESEEDDGKKA